jgi:large subunit ribosomal protein L10
MSETKKKGRATVSPQKEKVVKEIISLISKYPIVGVVNMENLPAKQLANMRAQLRGKIVLYMTKKRLIKIALSKCTQPNIKDLEKYLKGMPALLLTDQNPFALYSLLKKKRSNAAIKPGQIAPRDIVIPAGPTPFAPGPIIGELGAFKIKAGIDAGKVVVKEDKVIAKEGDLIDEKLAGLLLRFGIEPMEIGLGLVAAYEKGGIMPASVLDIDEKVYEQKFITAARDAFNLAVFAAIPSKDTIGVLIIKASREAKSVAKKGHILNEDTVGEELALAEAEAASVQKSAGL